MNECVYVYTKGSAMEQPPDSISIARLIQQLESDSPEPRIPELYNMYSLHGGACPPTCRTSPADPCHPELMRLETPRKDASKGGYSMYHEMFVYPRCHRLVLTQHPRAQDFKLHPDGHVYENTSKEDQPKPL
jgi:hypothetical protein